MNFSEQESTQPPAPGLQMEGRTGSNSRVRNLWLGAVIFLVLAAGSAISLIARSPERAPELSTGTIPSAEPSATLQPAITWSPQSIDIVLSPGESASRSFTVMSSVDLRDVVIEAVPTIAPFLTIKPSTVSRLRANRSQKVDVSFAIPANATLGTYDGTVHLRVGRQTFPQTLKVAVNAWNLFVSDSTTFSVKYPPHWSLSRESGGLTRLDSYSSSGNSEPEQYGPTDVTIELYELPLVGLSAVSDRVSDTEVLTVGGRSAIRGRRTDAAERLYTGYDMYVDCDTSVCVIAGTYDGRSGVALQMITTLQNTFTKR